MYTLYIMFVGGLFASLAFTKLINRRLRWNSHYFTMISTPLELHIRSFSNRRFGTKMLLSLFFKSQIEKFVSFIRLDCCIFERKTNNNNRIISNALPINYDEYFRQFSANAFTVNKSIPSWSALMLGFQSIIKPSSRLELTLMETVNSIAGYN